MINQIQSKSPNSSPVTSLEQTIIEGIRERKGKNITIITLDSVENASASKFIICEGSSTMQVSSIADSIREYVQEHADVKPFNYDGYRNCQWIVIDYGDTFVHVFLPDERARYNLEELWSDADISELPNID